MFYIDRKHLRQKETFQHKICGNNHKEMFIFKVKLDIHAKLNYKEKICVWNP